MKRWIDGCRVVDFGKPVYLTAKFSGPAADGKSGCVGPDSHSNSTARNPLYISRFCPERRMPHLPPRRETNSRTRWRRNTESDPSLIDCMSRQIARTPYSKPAAPGDPHGPLASATARWQPHRTGAYSNAGSSTPCVFTIASSPGGRAGTETVKVRNLHGLRIGARLRSQPAAFDHRSSDTAEPGEMRLGDRSAPDRAQIFQKSPSYAQESELPARFHAPIAPNRCFCRQYSVIAASPSTLITRLKL